MGDFLVSGSSDGFLEIWDFVSGKLQVEKFKYQGEKGMCHPSQVLSLSLSVDGELLASGDKEGNILVWEVESGNCLKQFKGVHDAAVSSLKFTKDSGQILSSSNDFNLKLHGLVSGKTLKTFVGHTSFVNDVSFVDEENHVLSCSSDGSVKIWDKKTTDCVHTFLPSKTNSNTNNTSSPSSSSSSYSSSSSNKNLSTNSLKDAMANVECVGETESLIVCTRSSTIFQTDFRGKIVKTFLLGTETDSFTFATLSPLRKYLYAGTSEGKILCFDFDSSKLLSTIQAHKKEVIGICKHPHASIIASFSLDRTLKIWKP